MTINIQFLISVLERAGEVVADNKQEAEQAINFLGANATITENTNGTFTIKLVSEEAEEKTALQVIQETLKEEFIIRSKKTKALVEKVKIVSFRFDSAMQSYLFTTDKESKSHGVVRKITFVATMKNNGVWHVS